MDTFVQYRKIDFWSSCQPRACTNPDPNCTPKTKIVVSFVFGRPGILEQRNYLPPRPRGSVEARGYWSKCVIYVIWCTLPPRPRLFLLRSTFVDRGAKKKCAVRPSQDQDCCPPRASYRQASVDLGARGEWENLWKTYLTRFAPLFTNSSITCWCKVHPFSIPSFLATDESSMGNLEWHRIRYIPRFGELAGTANVHW